MSGVQRFSVTNEAEQEAAAQAVASAVGHGKLVVIPTDTVYGIGADAFSHGAVQALLDAKGRGRQMPPPVLVSSSATLEALASDIPDYARALAEEFWPGALTLVLRQQPSLAWDLGETRGTVAVRVPDHDFARAVIDRTGPLAVSSANLSGQPVAHDADAAEAMLGGAVEVLVDGGPSSDAVASTIIDATGPAPRVLRRGAIDDAALLRVLAPLGHSLLDEG